MKRSQLIISIVGFAVLFVAAASAKAQVWVSPRASRGSGTGPRGICAGACRGLPASGIREPGPGCGRISETLLGRQAVLEGSLRSTASLVSAGLARTRLVRVAEALATVDAVPETSHRRNANQFTSRTGVREGFPHADRRGFAAGFGGRKLDRRMPVANSTGRAAQGSRPVPRVVPRSGRHNLRSKTTATRVAESPPCPVLESPGIAFCAPGPDSENGTSSLACDGAGGVNCSRLDQSRFQVLPR